MAALAALVLYAVTGPGAVPDATPSALLAMVLIGVGPMGLATLLWDHGVRHGDGRVLSTLAYLTPILSTLILVALALAIVTGAVLVGGALILIGIALAAFDAKDHSRR
ncbi:MAG: hypothetical protein AAFX39_03860 [Pseudomonadota bacterium]